MRPMRFDRWGNQLYTGETSYDFVGRRRTWYAIAAAVILLSIAALAFRGLNLGIEFTGGSEFRVSGAGEGVSELAAIDAVAVVVPESQVEATVVGGDSVRVRTDQLDSEQTDDVRDALADAYEVPVTDVTSSFVGPSWGEDVSQRALQGLIIFLLLVSLVITAYFRTWKMAVAALVALLHDLVVTVGVYAAVGFEVTPASVIGFLTILGYSLYDTVVVFDKVRENTKDVLENPNQTYAGAANLAVNQTLVRSINTSVVALLPVGSILFIGSFLAGAGTLQDLSLALFVGIAAGTYSSVFIATPLLVHLRGSEEVIKTHARKVQERRERSPVAAGGAASPARAEPDGGELTSSARSNSDSPTQGEIPGADGHRAGQRLQPKRTPRRRR